MLAVGQPRRRDCFGRPDLQQVLIALVNMISQLNLIGFASAVALILERSEIIGAKINVDFAIGGRLGNG